MADLSAGIGRGSTPRNGPGSIATVAADRPRPAMIWASSPPVEWPITAGFLFSLPITSAVCSATCLRFFFAKTSGFARARGSHSGVSRLLEQLHPVVPAAGQQPEAVDEDDRRAAGGVRLVDLAGLSFRDAGHAQTLPSGLMKPLPPSAFDADPENSFPGA